MSGEGNRPHYGLLDTVRGLCLLSMVAYHGMYDLVDIFGLPSAWYTGLPGYIWQQSICWTFILLSGMCWQLSRHHVKRGLLLVGCGAAISLITWLVMPSQRILYGVLNLLGLSALLLIPLDKLFRKVPAWAGLGGALLLFALTKNVSRGSLGFEGLALCPLPESPPAFGARTTSPCCPGSSCSAPATSCGGSSPKASGPKNCWRPACAP